MKKCKIESCEKDSRSRGWCEKHYTRWRSHGDPLVSKRNADPVTREFLLSRSIVKKETGCIEWQGTINKGYGQVRFRGKTEGAHRVSFKLNIGDIPDGLYVCHTCDNPPCINPEHLWVGTMEDNMRDARLKGRMHRGEKNGLVKLTETDVKQIREMTCSQREMAEIFGVSTSTISIIQRRETWSWLT